MKKSVYKRKYLNDYCEQRGTEDLCEGCKLDGSDYKCNFSTASDSEIDGMYETLTGGEQNEEIIKPKGKSVRHTEEG